MRLDWLASYSKASEAILQHWFWKLLKSTTQNFAPLHQVFVRVKSSSPNCGSEAWTEIFLLYPLSNASSSGVIVACRRKPVSTLRCLFATTKSLRSFFLRLAARIMTTTEPSPFSLKLLRTLCVWAPTLLTTTLITESPLLCLSVLRCLLFFGSVQDIFFGGLSLWRAIRLEGCVILCV